MHATRKEDEIQGLKCAFEKALVSVGFWSCYVNHFHGCQTLAEDVGSMLSGGRRQRLLQARALYRKPQILVLDEATSHLDVALEREVNETVRRLQVTRIVIAHRPETIASADRILDLAQFLVGPTWLV